MGMSKWISAEEMMPSERSTGLMALWAEHLKKRLPEGCVYRSRSDDVIVAVTLKLGGIRRVTTGWTKEGEWQVDFYRPDEYVVTHWMPMPELPEKI